MAAAAEVTTPPEDYMNAKKNDKVRDLSTKKIDEEKAQQVKGGKTSVGPKKPNQ